MASETETKHIKNSMDAESSIGSQSSLDLESVTGVKNETVREENSMGTQPVGRLVLLTGLPLMLSLLINSMYNFVDSVFVSRISEEALTALSLSAPVQILVSALGFGNAVGLNAVISKALGEKNEAQV